MLVSILVGSVIVCQLRSSLHIFSMLLNVAEDLCEAPANGSNFHILRIRPDQEVVCPENSVRHNKSNEHIQGIVELACDYADITTERHNSNDQQENVSKPFHIP